MKTKQIAVLLFILINTTSCYVINQAGPFLHHRLNDKPISQILEEKSTDKETRAFLKEVTQIKEFAINELGLNEDKNYSTYIEVEKDYVATVVCASPPFSLEPWQWNYPIVGKMPYKGFYKEEEAVREARKLNKKGLDVYIRRVEAFSSLGYFTDPLFSYMKNYTPYDLANLIIHEQTHATLFFKGQAQFNEELASFVGDTGARLYVRRFYGEESEEYRSIDIRKQDSETYRQYIAGLKDSLSALYARDDLEEPAMRNEKKAIITGSQRRFREEYETLFSTPAYRGFADMELNNAYLSQFNIYFEDLSLYSGIYELCGRSLPDMLEKLRLLEKEADPRAALKKWLKDF